MILVRRDVLSDETIQSLEQSESDDPFANLIETKLCDISSKLPQCNYDWTLSLKHRIRHGGNLSFHLSKFFNVHW